MKKDEFYAWAKESSWAYYGKPDSAFGDEIWVTPEGRTIMVRFRSGQTYIEPKPAAPHRYLPYRIEDLQFWLR